MENVSSRVHRDLLGSILGILVFLGGIALLLVVFRLAYDMFHVPPREALDLHPGKTVDLSATGSNAVGILLRVLLLFVMGIVGSLVATRGVTMYSHSRHVVNEPS